MTKNERREFLKAALAAMGGVAGAVGCNPPGAMCYKPATPPSVTTPCPECGQMMIAGEKDEILNGYQVPLKRIRDQGIDANLIIPEHCPTCGFGLKEGKFQLEIKHPDRPEPTRVELDSASDLEKFSLDLQKLNEVTEDKAEKRDELTERLKKLGEEEPPKKVEDIGTMCYRIVIRPKD